VVSPVDGVVGEVRAGPGDQVETGQVLAVVEEPAEKPAEEAS
jgi:biotin carboxyl carrier protein